MKKAKFLITAFAVFGALLMLMATCVARPVQEKTSVEVFEYAEEELVNSLGALGIKLSRDFEVNVLLDSITRNPEVVLITNSMKRARSEEDVLLGVEQLAGVLQDNAEFEHLVTILEEDYSSETGAISVELESMGYNTRDLEDIIEILLLIIQIIKVVIQIVNMIITLIDLIKNLIDLIRDLLDLISGGDDGGTPAY